MPTIDSLPVEVQQQTLLAVHDLSPVPSVEGFTSDPTLELTASGSPPLKNCTLACRLWRELTRDLLFSNSRCRLVYAPSETGPNDAVLEMLSERARQYASTMQALGVTQHISSLTVICDEELPRPSYGVAGIEEPTWTSRLSLLNDFWPRLLDPLPNLRTVTIVAHPRMMAVLLGVHPSSGHKNHSFSDHHREGVRYARFSLDIPEEVRRCSESNEAEDNGVENSSKWPRLYPFDVKYARKWKHFAYNEGSRLNLYLNDVKKWNYSGMCDSLLGVLFCWRVGQASISACELPPDMPASEQGEEPIYFADQINSFLHVAPFPSYTFIRRYYGRAFQIRMDEYEDPGREYVFNQGVGLPQFEYLTVKFGDVRRIEGWEDCFESESEERWRKWREAYDMTLIYALYLLPVGAVLTFLSGGKGDRNFEGLQRVEGDELFRHVIGDWQRVSNGDASKSTSWQRISFTTPPQDSP